jgi:hypothetical protein
MTPDDPGFVHRVEQELDKATALLARGVAAQRAPHYTDTARFLILLDLSGGLRLLLGVAHRVLTGPPEVAPVGRRPTLTEQLAAVLAAFPVRVQRTDEGERIHRFLHGDGLLRDLLGALDVFEQARAGDPLAWPGGAAVQGTPEAAWRALEWAVAERVFPEVEERERRRRSTDAGAFQQPVNDVIVQGVTRTVDDVFTLLMRASGLPGVRSGAARWRQRLGHGAP